MEGGRKERGKEGGREGERGEREGGREGGRGRGENYDTIFFCYEAGHLKY